MITVENLVFEYPAKRALHGISFTIKSSSITALVGPNGAGKTTLLRCLSALDVPFSGTIFLDGVSVLDYPRRCHRKVGYLSDFFGLYDDLTVRQCLTHVINTHGISSYKKAALVGNTVQRLSITDYIDVKAGELSRGLRQRLAIGQAIIHGPQVLLLDEPASGLDPEARHSLSMLMLQLRDEGMTLMVSSHILAELGEYSTEMLILNEGRIIEHRSVTCSEKEHRIIRIELTKSIDTYLSILKTEEGISNFHHQGQSAWFEFVGSEQSQGELLKQLIEKKVPICAFSEEKESLQDAYLAQVSPGIMRKDSNEH